MIFVEYDSGVRVTPMARPESGFHDYTREIVFEPRVTPTEIEAWIEGYSVAMRPQNQWFRVKRTPQGRIVFQFGYDSGD